MKKRDHLHVFTYRVTLVYLIVGILWITLSDKLLELFIPDAAILSDVQTYKGLFFILLTTTLLYITVRIQMNRLRRIDKKLKEKNADYKALYEKYQIRSDEVKEAWDKAGEDETFLAVVLDNIPNLVFVKDAMNGTYLLLNKAVGDLMGLDRSEVIGKDDFSVFPKELAQRMVQEDFETVLGGVPLSIEETIPAQGGMKTLHSIKIPIADISGQTRYLLGVSEDITPKKMAEKELISAKEKAEESNRLKTAFLQNISHEIRTPMNAITGFSGLMLEPDISIDQKTKYASIIQTNCDKLLTIVSDVLTISAVETNQMEIHLQEVDLNRMMDELTSIFSGTVQRHGLEFRNTTRLPEKVVVRTDKTKLMEIQNNLINNALKFTTTGSIEINCRLEGANMIFSVKDTGIGFKDELKDKIFERFRQASQDSNREYGGTGLGLAICKAFVELLGGTINVQSEEGKGSEFSYSLPCDPISPKKGSASEIGKSAGEVITILIAEDEDMNYLFLETLLQPMNWRLIRACDGQEAVDLVLEDPSIRLVLMDIRMPVKNGQQAAIEIKKFRPNLPIIAQTAYALDFEIEQYGGVFDDYMTKPLRAQILKQKILEYLV
jgi:PAS domain S-box-containing protein